MGNQKRRQQQPDEPQSSLPTTHEPQSREALRPPKLPPLPRLDEPIELTEDGLAPAVRKQPRRKGFGLLAFLGASVSAVVLAGRCETPPPAGPSLTVSKDDPEPKSPAPAPKPRRDYPATPHPDPAPWAKAFKAPDKIHYTVQRGGTLKNVANLFMVHHHEIIALNPGLDLDAELAPGTTVVVHEREAGEDSRSVGFPNDGRVEGAIPMVPGPGRQLMALPYKSWGTVRTVMLLDQVLRRWDAGRPNRQPVLVGNLSSRRGGRLRPHATHQSGRDVDLGFIQKLKPGEELGWRMIDRSNLDAAETWQLLFLLAQTGVLEVIYADRSIQQLLYEHALEHDLFDDKELARWIEYPRPVGETNALIQHVSGHTDHLHVRFSCPSGDPDCHEL